MNQTVSYFQPQSSIACTNTESPNLIHRRLGHPRLNKLKNTVHAWCQLKSLECESCQLGKHVQATFVGKFSLQANSPIDLINTNVCGPSRVSSILG